ncbi:centrosomal protein of 131 kDa-like [Artemia franciscana]|uniref:centrosomal protein of 131 kDa-like n=1 Tax=Artemia franciscana TaxID=6661 RepID=UPI0032DB8958
MATSGYLLDIRCGCDRREQVVEFRYLRNTVENTGSNAREFQLRLGQAHELTNVSVSLILNSLYSLYLPQLQTEKQEQQIKISTLSRELERTKKKYEENRKTTEERHSAEIKRIRASFTAAQRQQRSRWLSEKTNHIKEMTVRGLEPELHRLMDQHKQELDTIRTLHRAELQRLQDTLTSNNLSQIENMKCQFQLEKDAACAKERESFQTKLEREINDLERSYMERHTRLEAELNRERDRASSELARIQQENEDYVRKLQEKFSREKAYLAEEANSELKLIESKNQMQIKSLSDTLRREKEEALDRLNESYEQKVQNLTILNSNLSSKLQQGEKEAKMMQENFADEMSKMRSHQESQHEQTLKNLKEKFRSEISELEARIDEQKAKILNLRTNLSTKEEEIASLRVSFSLRTKELEEAQTKITKYSSEKDDLKKVVQSEMRGELELLEDERNKLRGEVSRIRSEYCVSILEKEGEISQLKIKHERELRDLHDRVREAVAVKDETIARLQQKLHAALARCQNLEDLVDKAQRNKFDSKT